MRDILTILACLLIAALTAALAVPPLVNWPAHRAFVDRAISRAVGLEARSVGALDIRLLPAPRIKLERLQIGSGAASLDAMFVRAEVALTPLLSGEVRFLDTRIGRAEIRLPTGPGGEWRVPRRLVAPSADSRALVFEALSVAQLLLTTTEPATGRTDQAYAEAVRLQASSLRGPWRVDGTTAGVPFELALGEIGLDLSASLKGGGGGGARPRFDVDGKLELVGGPDGSLVPRFAGAGKLAVAPASRTSETAPLPISIQAALKASGREVALDGIVLEAGDAAAPLRLTGGGRYALDGSRLTLALEGRRVDLPALLAGSPGGFGPRLGAWSGFAERPIDLSLKLDSLALGGEDDLTGVQASGSLRDRRIQVDRLEMAGPGGAALAASGEVEIGGRGVTGSGRVRLTARESDRLARFAATFGFEGLRDVVDARPLEASADVTLADPVISVRNLRIVQGDTTISGAGRYSPPEAGARGRVDAQLAVTGLDLSRGPDPAPLFAAARTIDYGLVLDARAIAYGTSREGRAAARLSTEGESVLVDTLELTNLAGAEARLSGRLSPDGSGRIEGRLKASRAAPLVDLFGRAWLGGAAALVPPLLRQGALDVAVRAERVAEAGGPPTALRTAISGTAAGGPIEGSTVSVNGEVRNLAATLSTDRAETWLGVAAPALRRPARMEIKAARDGAGRLAAGLNGEVAGVRVATLRPLSLGRGDGRLDDGEVELAGPDLSVARALLGDVSGLGGPGGFALKAKLSRTDALRLALAGRVSDADLTADLSLSSTTEIAGTAALSRLSLPWVASVLALQAPAAAPPGALWPSARFGSDPPPAIGGSVRVRAASLDLGAGLVGSDAAFLLAATPDGVGFRDLSFGLAGGRVTGEFSLNRQGGLVSLIGDGAFQKLEVSAAFGPPFEAGRFSGALRFGASGESVSGLVSNLGGAGQLELDGLRIAAADPAGVERAVARALRGEDPLNAARLGTMLAEELGRGPFVSARAAAAVTLTGGSLRLTPLRLDSEAGAWRGAATIDLRTLSLDARGALQPKAAPRNWSAPPPYVTLGWAGPLARPARTIDPGPAVNGLAAVVLQRELERIEVFELDAAERTRLNARIEMDKQRRLAAEEALRQARLREEAAERARMEAERTRAEAERARAAAEAAASAVPNPPERRPVPFEIRPPAQIGGGAAPGG